MLDVVSIVAINNVERNVKFYWSSVESCVTFRAFCVTYVYTTAIINTIALPRWCDAGLAASYQTWWSRDALISTGAELLGALFASRDVNSSTRRQLNTPTVGATESDWRLTPSKSRLSHLHAQLSFFFLLFFFQYRSVIHPSLQKIRLTNLTKPSCERHE